jgi:hypothetical protein
MQTKRLGAWLKWCRACLACTRPWVQSPAPEKQNTNTKIECTALHPPTQSAHLHPSISDSTMIILLPSQAPIWLIFDDSLPQSTPYHTLWRSNPSHPTWAQVEGGCGVATGHMFHTRGRKSLMDAFCFGPPRVLMMGSVSSLGGILPFSQPIFLKWCRGTSQPQEGWHRDRSG